MFSKREGGRELFLQYINENRKARLKETSAKYAKLPENVRAAIAKVADVPNVPLCDLSPIERTVMLRVAKDLSNKLASAAYVLVSAQTLD